MLLTLRARLTYLHFVLTVVLLLLAVLPVGFLRRNCRRGLGRGRSRIGFALGIGTRMVIHHSGVILFSRAPRRGNRLLETLRHLVRVSESFVNNLRFLFATQNFLLILGKLSSRASWKQTLLRMPRYSVCGKKMAKSERRKGKAA
jgi:hypothetical protein